MYGVPWESQEVFRVEMGPENLVRVHDCLILMCFPPIRSYFLNELFPRALLSPRVRARSFPPRHARISPTPKESPSSFALGEVSGWTHALQRVERQGAGHALALVPGR